MGLFTLLNLKNDPVIDWEMSPEYTFGTFESWGGKERIRSQKERIYYFFIDAWEDQPRLCLMERGIKHARVVAEIRAPREMVQRCVDGQGKVAMFERTFGINEELRKWLCEHVIDAKSNELIIPIEEEVSDGLGETGLPLAETFQQETHRITLPVGPEELTEEDVAGLARTYDFFDFERNPDGSFTNILVDNGDGLTVTDLATGLMWQRQGSDIMSHRSMRKELQRVNEEGFAGHHDWRFPSMAEALSLMERERVHDQHLHGCFATTQPFIFVDAVRRPGGYWFVDYKHGRAFWSSGTIPGGFGRFCREMSSGS
jgi:hypothetical protein